MNEHNKKSESRRICEMCNKQWCRDSDAFDLNFSKCSAKWFCTSLINGCVSITELVWASTIRAVERQHKIILHEGFRCAWSNVVQSHLNLKRIRILFFIINTVRPPSVHRTLRWRENDSDNLFYYLQNFEFNPGNYLRLRPNQIFV